MLTLGARAPRPLSCALLSLEGVLRKTGSRFALNAGEGARGPGSDGTVLKRNRTLRATFNDKELETVGYCSFFP